MAAANKKIGKYSGFEKKKFLFVYLFIAFPVLQFLVFWVYVNASSIAIAFQRAETGAFTLKNMELVLQTLFVKAIDTTGTPLWPIILRSIFLWGLEFFILFPIGVTTTYILFRRIPGHYVLRICYIIPGLIGSVIWAMIIRYMVGAEGFLVKTYLSLGLPSDVYLEMGGLFGSALTAFPTIVVVKITMGLVGNNAVLTGAFTRVPDELYESAELDGAGFWRTYVSVAIPCVWSTIATLMTFSLCSFVTADYNVFLFTNGNGSNGTATIGFLLYRLTLDIAEGAQNNGKPYYGYPAALGVLLTCITLPVVLIGRKIIDKIFVDVEV